MPAVIELGFSAFELSESRAGQKHIHLQRALHNGRAVRHDSDHGAGKFIESDRRANDAHIGAELLSPDPFAQHDDWRGAGRVIFQEGPSLDRVDAEQGEIVTADGAGPHTPGRRGSAEINRRWDTAYRCDAREHVAAAVAKINIIQI